MAASPEFIELLKDCMRGLGPVTARRMFGGAGIYADGVMFALVADDTLYLKTDDETCARFAAEGLGPFTYELRGRTTEFSYWRAPDRLLDDPDEMLAWAQTALAAARRSASSKRVAGSRRKPKTGKVAG